MDVACIVRNSACTSAYPDVIPDVRRVATGVGTPLVKNNRRNLIFMRMLLVIKVSHADPISRYARRASYGGSFGEVDANDFVVMRAT